MDAGAEARGDFLQEGIFSHGQEDTTREKRQSRGPG